MDDLTSSLEEMTNRKQMLSESVMKAKVGKEETVSTFSLVLNSSHVKSIRSATRENLSSGFPTKRVSSQSPQLQRLARELKFHL